MIYKDFDLFIQHIRQNARVIAIDYGSKKSGIAISDRTLTISSPYSVIKNASKTHFIEQLKNIISENIIWGIIIGFPLQMDGKEGKACDVILDLATNLTTIINLPILLVDERETSVRAHEILKEMSFKRKKRENFDDKIAANILLERFLEKLHNMKH